MSSRECSSIADEPIVSPVLCTFNISKCNGGSNSSLWLVETECLSCNVHVKGKGIPYFKTSVQSHSSLSEQFSIFFNASTAK